MELTSEALDNYRKNLWCLEEVADRLLGHMKGHDFSFRPEITDKNGSFKEEKLRAFVEELMSGWERELRDGVYPDTPGVEDSAEGYIRARRELYGLYLYLAMRCSLCEGAFAYAVGGEDRERTDFAFILDHARRLSRSFCVMIGPDGAKTNEPYDGFDACFGLHLYRVLEDPEGKNSDSGLTPSWRIPAQNPASLTNEGRMKHVFLKRSSPLPDAEDVAEETPEGNVRDEDDFDDGYEPDEDWELEPLEDAFLAYDPGELSAEYERADALSYLSARFEGRDEYLAACRRFVSLYRSAPPEITWGFYGELEEVVNLYLLRHGLAVLADTDKALDVYSRVFDGPCRQAKRYARGLQWNKL